MSQSKRPELDPSKQNSSRVPFAEDNDQSRFTFVLDKNQPGTRSHAMRAHWQERRKRMQDERKANDGKGRTRPLRSKSDSAADLLASPLSTTTASDTESPIVVTAAPPPQTSVRDPSFYPFSDAGFPSPSHDYEQQQPQQQYGLSEKQQAASPPSNVSQGIQAQIVNGVNYAFTSSKLDPFDTFPVVLTTEHHMLIHHWLTTHATMMFDQMTASDFNPMRDVWFPLDFSNAASFNIIMAHSAAHLAYCYDGTAPIRGTNSFKALEYKAHAVEILTQWMSSPEQALSNDAFAAVVRLLTFERYWGTQDQWQIHRDGLERMIQARGGLHELHNDWRLELVVGLVSLMSQPSWFSPTNNISGISSAVLGIRIAIERMRSLWLISFIQDMRNLMSMSLQLYQGGLLMFPAIHTAVLLIQSNYESAINGYSDAEDSDRLAALFCISIIVQESASSSFAHSSTSATENNNALSLLDLSLFGAPNTWKTSMRNLRSFLHQYFLQSYVSGSEKINYVMQMTDIVSNLSLESRQGIERCLLNMFCRSSDGKFIFRPDEGATPDSLLSSVRGL
ncbi:hypothetical protein TSTA_030610 [Talaromyces stipitatus ATCC 10500]|uniref:Tachykinin family protein n=1 Tax=Talaromyces stipitatus (strain ATCC 10500 / CBS 375.48 / QM 6759 / NRRL 1006) TaxID=441959 RepID=B8M7R6_TALSN|nr:uncharacterized protein TSTA_030610 [Talaromyces stipitatus ATCC 10500]EED19795.1 hypothetical protein TSTA_030610 [Talaromyces stipitatus ATCC 10500]